MDTTLLKGLEILERAISADAPVTVSALARAMGLPKSNIHRALTTLTAAGYLQHDAIARQYSPALKVVILGQQVSRGYPFKTSLMPHLERLAAETGETAAYARPTPDGILVLAHALPARSFAAILPENMRLDPSDTAFGLLFDGPSGVDPGARHVLISDHADRHTFELAIPLARDGTPALGALGLVGPASRHDPARIAGFLIALRATREAVIGSPERSAP